MSNQDDLASADANVETEEFNQDNQQLVAYLDGELDEVQSQDIERRLSDDPEFRLRLQQLQQAWDLLDELPQANRDEDFTRSTVEFVALNARQHLAETKQWSQASSTKSVIWRVLALVAVTLLGWYLGDWYFGKQHRQLLEDIEVISEFDQYRLTDDFDFMQKLEASGVFHTEGESDED